jgi:virginiamycin A acetyltransferase
MPQSNEKSPSAEKIVDPVERSGFIIAVKRIAQAGFLALVLPRLLIYFLGQGVFGDQAFSSASESIARKSGRWGVFMRQAFYGKLLSSCGKDVYIGWGTVFSMREASLGDRSYIGRNCNIGYGRIGNDVMLADSVIVLSGGREHSMDAEAGVMHDQRQVFRQTAIGDGSWIGAGSIIMADVGKECVIGAGAVVNKPIPDGAVAVGVPARVVKFRPGFSDQKS